jgi:hypothetical protein
MPFLHMRFGWNDAGMNIAVLIMSESGWRDIPNLGVDGTTIQESGFAGSDCGGILGMSADSLGRRTFLGIEWDPFVLSLVSLETEICYTKKEL